MTAAAFAGFLRRELAPTPGRGSATFRLTLACLVATIPILTHHIPHALVVMIVMYLITQEDTAATLIGSILGVAGVTVGLSAALLAWMVALDIAWLRIGCFIAFLVVGLFLKRVLVIGALGSAIGLPGALVMILPDVAPLPPESLVEFALWIWWCVTLGLAVNLAVQLLLAPGDPLTLLRGELDTRLRVVEETVRGLSGTSDVAPQASRSTLASLATAGMSRPIALLKSASLTNSLARQAHETLAATITLADRLVTDADTLGRLVASTPSAPTRESLLRVADGCARTRRMLADPQWPQPVESADRPLPFELGAAALPPLADMGRTLDQLSAAAGVGLPSPAAKEPGPRLLLPDAATNPEYVRFAVKGAVAALICYVLFIGFDYPGIYTSVITCFVVSLSTIGSSNQKGLLRFGGAALGGVMGVGALVYAFPNIDGVGGFWLVFAFGTAVAAWINFGTPRISYGGYQTGLAFYKATFQSLGPAVSATVVRDRLIGVAFGLIVFGVVEHVLWPARATDRMRARLGDGFRSLAGFARTASGGLEDAGVGARRALISQQLTDVQGFIESSKFESGESASEAEAVERLTAEAQSVFLVLLAIARDAESAATRPDTVRMATTRFDGAVGTILETLAERLEQGSSAALIAVDDARAALDQSTGALQEVLRDGDTYAGTLALYRELAVAVNRAVTSDGERTGGGQHGVDRSGYVSASDA